MMSDTDNMALWHSVEKTDPAHTKKITGKSYKGDSPKPYWLIRRATEVFGPVGIGWGFSIEERIENGAMIEPGHFERLHLAKVKVWYKWHGERGEVEHVGGTPMSGKRSDGRTYTDEDCAKKSVTDALVKALSMIGFAGDIFIGRYDDSNYVAEVRRDFAEAAQEASPQATDILAAADKALVTAAMNGTEALLEAWKKLAPETRELFGNRAPDRLKKIAADHDARKAA